MNQILKELNEVTCKFMAQVKSTELADVAPKSLLEQETADLEVEFQNYEEIVHEFLRANSETLHIIYNEVNKSCTGSGSQPEVHNMMHYCGITARQSRSLQTNPLKK